MTESATDVRDATEIATIKEQLPYVEQHKPRRTGLKLLGILVFWLVGFFALQGQMTKALGLQDTTELHQKFNDARDWVQLEGTDNWLVGGVFGGISDALNAIVLFFQELIAIPAFPRPVPEIGWLGVVALAAWITYAFAGLRSTILVTATLLVLRRRRPLVGQHGHAHHHAARRRDLHGGRHPARHLDGSQQSRVELRHAGPRHHADVPAVLLPGPARPVLRHRLGVRARADDHLRAAARSSGSPSTASARSRRRRRRRPGRWASPAARCSARCSCRWPAAPSWSASTSA